ncbi:MAG: DUF1329 domain-containing protein [bacterium]
MRDSIKIGRGKWSLRIGLALASLGILLAAMNASALTIGKTYDATNWEELQGYGPPHLIDYVKAGEFIITPVDLEFEWKITDQEFLRASKENEGKFDLDDEGYLAYKEGKGRPDFVFGYPFPTIDPKNPKAGAMVMENVNYVRYRQGSTRLVGKCSWIGKGGKERDAVFGGDFLYYQGRSRGQIPNPRNYLEQQMNFVIQPFELRGVVQMISIYNSDKESEMYAYVPMLRRVRRTSPAARSNPFMGSDLSADDTNCWSGKNASFAWKLVGETTILTPFTSAKKSTVTQDENGTITMKLPELNLGYRVPGWKGASWAPTNMAWHPLEAWVVEGNPKDPYYNYGRQLFYVDKGAYALWYKEISDRSGDYWKLVFTTQSWQQTQNGLDTIGNQDCYFGIDSKTSHCTFCELTVSPARQWQVNLPLEQLGPDLYTESQLLQKTK